jgi:S-DNA-T family DNA segregation ATPase FtsK/SpoIIIE
MTNRPSEMTMLLVDPRGKAFQPFDGSSHLSRPVIRDSEGATEALTSLVRLMERRGELQSNPAMGREGRPYVVLVIDELADLLMTGGKALQRPLTRLLQRGRGAGVHVVAATQKPTASVLGSLIKANFPVRLVGRVTSATDARVASGWSGTGAERLEGRGDFIAVAEGKVTRFQAAHVAPREIRRAMARGGGASTSLSGPRRRVAGDILPAPVGRLTEVFSGGVWR